MRPHLPCVSPGEEGEARGPVLLRAPHAVRSAPTPRTAAEQNRQQRRAVFRALHSLLKAVWWPSRTHTDLQDRMGDVLHMHVRLLPVP